MTYDFTMSSDKRTIPMMLYKDGYDFPWEKTIDALKNDTDLPTNDGLWALNWIGHHLKAMNYTMEFDLSAPSARGAVELWALMMDKVPQAAPHLRLMWKDINSPRLIHRALDVGEDCVYALVEKRPELCRFFALGWFSWKNPPYIPDPNVRLTLAFMDYYDSFHFIEKSPMDAYVRQLNKDQKDHSVLVSNFGVPDRSSSEFIKTKEHLQRVVQDTYASLLGKPIGNTSRLVKFLEEVGTMHQLLNSAQQEITPIDFSDFESTSYA